MTLGMLGRVGNVNPVVASKIKLASAELIIISKYCPALKVDTKFNAIIA